MCKPFPQQSRVRNGAGYRAEDFEPHPVSSLFAFPLFLLAIQRGYHSQEATRIEGLIAKRYSRTNVNLTTRHTGHRASQPSVTPLRVSVHSITWSRVRLRKCSHSRYSVRLLTARSDEKTH
jgi:hypothetical protein